MMGLPFAPRHVDESTSHGKGPQAGVVVGSAPGVWSPVNYISGPGPVYTAFGYLLPISNAARCCEGMK